MGKDLLLLFALKVRCKSTYFLLLLK